ncbi:MAG: hypothetical protein ACFFDT_08110 [Candidatus Hodarchaeota archaeon]
MRKKNVILFLCSIFLILNISMITIGARGAFTIEKFWKEGGRITFESKINTDFEGDLFDFDFTFEGIYQYNGSSSSENLVFNFTLISPADEFILAEDEGLLQSGFFIAVTANLGKGDEIDYDFTVNGDIYFIIFNQTQFINWYDGDDLGQIETEYPTPIYTKIGDSGTFTVTAPDVYFFVWWNDGTIDVNLQFQLYARLVERIEISEYIEIDPYMLETAEGDEFTSLGMDTSDWEIDKIITLEIENEDVDFSIIREDEFKIYYNNVSTEIPCWVLEVEDFETQSIEEEDVYTFKTDYKIWKSKYSGITLRSITDMEVYNSTSSLQATILEKYTVKSADNVLLLKSSGITFPFLPTVIGISVLFLFKKKNQKN